MARQVRSGSSTLISRFVRHSGIWSFRRVLLALLLLTACDLVRGANLPIDLPEIRPAPTTAATSTPTSLATMTAGAAQPQPQATATPFSPIVLWVPPDFDPSSGSPAGEMLYQRVQEFSRRNGGVQVQVRVKATSGAGGLLESLGAAAAAAPDALPSVVALPRGDLEIAALKGLVLPLDGLSTVIDEADWFDYARQLAMVQGATFALPFAGDALVLAYRPAKVAIPPLDWPAAFRISQPLAFPAGDPQSMFVLSLYQSVGGEVEDAQRRPMLQPERLSQVLQLLADGEERGIFPYWLSQYETSGQVWQAYREGRVNALVTWVSNYLTNLPPDTVAVPVPRINDSSLTLATGWGWAVADPIPERRALSVKLAEYLCEGDFLAGWSEAAGYLPTRPSTLAAWSNQSLKTLLSPVVISAQARPTVDQLSGLGPVLKEATLKVLKRDSDPTQAAKAASEKLALPEAK